MMSELLGGAQSKENPMKERQTIRNVAGVAYAGKFLLIPACYL